MRSLWVVRGSKRWIHTVGRQLSQQWTNASSLKLTLPPSSSSTIIHIIHHHPHQYHRDQHHHRHYYHKENFSYAFQSWLEFRWRELYKIIYDNYLNGKKYELFEENTKILRTLCIFALWWRLMKPLQKDSSVTIIVILLSPLSRAPHWLNDQGTHTTIAMHWNFQTRRPPTTYGRFASKQPDLDFWALALQWISMLESSSFILCILNTSNCLILHGEIFLLLLFTMLSNSSTQCNGWF